MRKFAIVSITFVLVLLASIDGAAQDRPLKGMVWRVPDDLQLAEADLVQMARAGVEAVRTDLITAPQLLTLADTLGLQLFQELPITYLPARALADTVDYAWRLLAPAVQAARRDSMPRAFGLARYSDTSDTTACTFFEQLAERVRARAPAGTRVYYVTAFINQDYCARTVDFVLLDARDRAAPADLLARWHASRDSANAVPVGLAAVGAWVRPDSLRRGGGVSRQRQARYLEEQLGALLQDSSATAPVAVFAYRWRDDIAASPSPRHDLSNPYRLAYGLYEPDGRPRPAYEVVAGLYSGRQDVFALQPAAEGTFSYNWLILLGWGVLLVLGLFYALSPRFRQMVPRYFRAHGFYREAVRDGRDVLFGSSIVLLVVLALGVGLVACVILESLRTEDGFALLLRWLPESVQQMTVALLARPWMLVLLFGSIYAFSLVLWSSVLSILSRRRYPLSPGQAVMLVVWPRWIFLALMVAAMVIITLPQPLAGRAALILLGIWFLVALYAIARTLVDYYAITRMRVQMLAASLAANPFLLLLLLGIYAVLENLPEVRFVVNLMGE